MGSYQRFLSSLRSPKGGRQSWALFWSHGCEHVGVSSFRLKPHQPLQSKKSYSDVDHRDNNWCCTARLFRHACPIHSRRIDFRGRKRVHDANANGLCRSSSRIFLQRGGGNFHGPIRLRNGPWTSYYGGVGKQFWLFHNVFLPGFHLGAQSPLFFDSAQGK